MTTFIKLEEPHRMVKVEMERGERISQLHFLLMKLERENDLVVSFFLYSRREKSSL